jgi:hypothetical protein
VIEHVDAHGNGTWTHVVVSGGHDPELSAAVALATAWLAGRLLANAWCGASTKRNNVAMARAAATRSNARGPVLDLNATSSRRLV